MQNHRARPSLATPIAASCLAILACAPTVTLTPLGSGRVYPATPDSVAIPLYATTKPECPYEELAVVTAEGSTGGTKAAAVLEALLTQARALGAQAIVGFEQSRRATGSDGSDVDVRSGTAIRFRSPDCTK